MVTLQNGVEITDSMLNVILITLLDLKESDPITFYELVMKCRDDNHRIFGKTVDVLKEWWFIDATERVRDVYRDVVLSFVQGDGTSLSLVSPVAVE